jgi:hypothetical protein
MPFFVDGDPSPSEISEAINYLLSNFQQTSSNNIDTGQVTDSTGNVVSYLYKYLYVKYADSFDGTLNFSNTPTNRQYYGLRNNDSSTESTNPADYIWYKVSGGFSTNKFIFYSVTGGRRINIVVGLSAPSILYQADTGAAINLDQISGSDGASSRICYAKSTSFALASTPATYQTSGPSGFPPYNTWGGSETWQATTPTLLSNEALFQSDGIYNPVTDLTTWNVPYLSNLKVGALSAITANLGSITAGSLNAVTITGSDLTIGSSPAISGTTMTGTGSHIYNDGRFITGNSSKNMVFDGSALYLNGIDNVATSLNSVVNWFGAGEITIATFTVPRNGKVIVSWQTTISVKCVTSASGAAPNISVYVKDSSNVVVSNSTSNIIPIGAPGYYGEPSVKRFSTPLTYSSVLNLTAGTYKLIGYDNGSSVWDSSNNFITSGVISSGPTASNTIYIYQTFA